MLKLNLGCGDRKLASFINVDAREEVDPDVVADVTSIHESFKDADLIYACHVLEHFPLKPSSFQPVTWKGVLRSWHTTLKEGGVLRLAVPDIEAVLEYYSETRDISSLYALLYGGQKYDFDFHYHCWSFETLKKDLLEAGFKEVKRYDWRKTEHFFADDYSQAYLPHMDKVNGKLMSLNVEAIK
jgi:predicted SAM-dependent methyltransferase